MADFKKLHVWQKAHELSLAIHQAAGGIRGSQYASLRSQMVRAAMSIPANIVEGRGQVTDRAFARYLRISLNSTSELEHHLITARDFRVISERTFLALVTKLIEIRKMLHGLINRLDPAPNHARSKPTPAANS